MAEYIEKQLVLSKSQQDYLEGRYDYDDFVLVSDIESIPPADVRPVVRGDWIGDGDCIICSNCKTAYTFMGSNFCPNCGADMRGGDTVMEENMVGSAEPGIYLPGKFGVRIEDVVIFKEDGCEDITHSPKNLIIL